MRILFISQELIGSGLCLRFVREGHDVKLFINDPYRKSCLSGFVSKTAHWQSELTWVGKDGLIVFDDVGFGEIQDTLRKQGFTVFGGNEIADRLELDRAFGQTIMNKYGIATLPSYNFQSIDEAITHVHNTKGPWVVKQNTHISILNHVGENEDGSDAIAALMLLKERGIKEVHLQKKAIGVEVGVARYFNGTQWVGPIEINHEHKRLYDGDQGPLTAEMGTVMWHSYDEQLPLYTETLKKLTPYLRSINYRGDIDINCMIYKNDLWPLEFTPRLGTPSIQLHSELYRGSLADFFFDVARGNQTNVDCFEGYGIVVALALPPFPNPPEAIRTTNDTVITFSDALTQNDYDSIYLEEVSKRINTQGEEEVYWSGSFGYVGYATAQGTTLDEAKELAYTRVNAITAPDLIYRTDIGLRVGTHDIPQLQTWGWI